MTRSPAQIAERLWGNARLYATNASDRMNSEKHAKRLTAEVEAAIEAAAAHRVNEILKDFNLKSRDQKTTELQKKKEEIKKLQEAIKSQEQTKR